MKFETAARSVGRRVSYRSQAKTLRDEEGVITSVGISLVFVRFGEEKGSKGCRPETLTLVPREEVGK